MASYLIRDDQGRAIERFTWDGKQGLPAAWRQRGWTVAEDTGEELWQPVPEAVSPAQFRVGLRRLGYWGEFLAFVEAQGDEAKDMIEYATEVRRHHPLVAMAKQQLGLTDQEVDDMFRMMSKLP